MRRIIFMLCLLFALSGCSGFMGKSNITNLLAAPKLSQTESEIVKAIDNHIGENITIKYSTSQGYASPVQLIDIDGDEIDEAIVFYYAPNKGANIRIALLSFEEGEWNIVFDKEGLGSDIFYFGTEKFKSLPTKQILVGYLATNMDENFFVTYFTDYSVKIDDYVESCQDVVVGDINYDNYSEVILTNNTKDGKVRLRALEWTDENSFKIVGTCSLKVYNIEVTQLLLGTSGDGERVLYVDYRDDYNQMHTEGILFRDGGKMNEAFTKSVISRHWEYTKALNCVDIDGDGTIETPSVIQEERTDAPDVLKTVEWTDYVRTEPLRKYIGIYDTQGALFVAIPDSWQNNVYSRYSSDGWYIYAVSDEETENDNPLVAVTQVDSPNGVETGAYSYIVYKDAKVWHIAFDRTVDLSEIQYVITSVTDLG